MRSNVKILNRDEVFAAYQNRQSTRNYDPQRKISAEDFHFILELGRLSPSSVGSEPWRFLVIQNRELRDKLKPVAWGMANQLDAASHLLIILAHRTRAVDEPFMLEGLKRRKVTEPEQINATLARYRQFVNEDMKLDSERALFDWTCKQCYIALANMMTGAAMIGIDSCPVEGFNYAKVNEILAGAGLFDPQQWGVAVAATFGYRAGPIERKSRRDFRDVVRFVE